MDHLHLLKRAFKISWRYRPLWLFGFLLALCGGGGGSGSGGNFGNIPGGGPGGGGDVPDVDPIIILILVAAVFLVIIVLSVLATIVRVVSRTALIGMVRQIDKTEAVTIGAGWRLGWSGKAWRVFLVSLLIDLPIIILAIFLLLSAFSPLLLLLTGSDVLKIVGVVVAVLAGLSVLLLLFLIGLAVAPLRELAWRGVVVHDRGVWDSLRESFGLIRHRFKDVAVVYLLLIGVGIGWGFVTLMVVLPVTLFSGLVAGGIPALLVYLLSQSGLGAAVAGLPLGLLVMILIGSFASGLYLVYQSAVWTLAYLKIEETGIEEPAPEEPPTTGSQPLTPAPEPEM